MAESAENFCNFAPTTVFNLKRTMKEELSNELLWRRKLTDAERNALRPELKLDVRLTDAIGKIPDAPVPSNFTARVMNAVELEEAQAERSRGWALNWRRLWPRVAVAAAVLIFAGVSIQRYETHSQRTVRAKNSVLLASLQPPPSVEALENLDAIQRMSQTAHADGELLAALQ